MHLKEMSYGFLKHPYLTIPMIVCSFLIENLFIKAALYKSKDWAYENEWRIICSTANSALEGKDRYPISKRPMAIYLGCQIPEVYRKILIHMADEKGISKYQMCVKNYSEKYELDFDPI